MELIVRIVLVLSQQPDPQSDAALFSFSIAFYYIPYMDVAFYDTSCTSGDSFHSLRAFRIEAGSVALVWDLGMYFLRSGQFPDPMLI